MSEILRIRKSTLDAIGNAIREKSGKANLINPLNMPREILALSSSNGGSDVNNSFLFDGNAFSAIAGSWVDRSGSLAGTISGGALTRTFNAYINDRTSQMIDVTNYNKLTVVFNNMSTGSSRTPFFGLWDTAPGNTVNDPTNFIAYTAITKTTDKTSYSIDISDITGSHYVGISLGMGGDYDSSYSIASIMLEAVGTSGDYSGVGTPIYDKGTCYIPMTEAYREGNVGFEKNDIFLYCDGTDWHKNSAVTTANAIDLTNVNEIVLISRVPQSGTSTPFTARIVLTSSKPNSHSGNVTENYEATATGNTTTGGEKVVTTTLNTTSITGSYYIIADAYSGAQSKAFTMYIDTMYYV